MVEFNIVHGGGLLGGQTIVVGNTEKYRIRFTDWLDEGVILDTLAVTDDSATVLISGESLSDDCLSLWFLVTPTTEGEFTVTVTVTTSDDQTLVYTIEYFGEDL